MSYPTLDRVTSGKFKVFSLLELAEEIEPEREEKSNDHLLKALRNHRRSSCKCSISMTGCKRKGGCHQFRFGGNDESKKMQKYILKQQFEGFSVSNTKGLHKGYDRFQSLLSSTASSSSSPQNVAFVSKNTSSTNEVSTAYYAPNLSGQNTNIGDQLMEKSGLDKSIQKKNDYALMALAIAKTTRYIGHSVSTVRGKRETAVKDPRQDCNWIPQNTMEDPNTNREYPHRALKIKELLISDVQAHDLEQRPTLMNFKTLMVALLLLEVQKRFIDVGILTKKITRAALLFVLPIWPILILQQYSSSNNNDKRAGSQRVRTSLMDDLERLRTRK
ncbi:hypothetical protein Tco_0623830 [Tanacetum coccineum]|uniref:Uncharacterized protein n=1 Tax=Tanacetum coccineum TaxID=301880 RepID=A0ABQ4WCC2_9ASTR